MVTPILHLLLKFIKVRIMNILVVYYVHNQYIYHDYFFTSYILSSFTQFRTWHLRYYSTINLLILVQKQE